MLDRVKARTFGEHPAGEDPLLLTRQGDFVHFHERGRVRLLRQGTRVTDARRHLQGSELDGLVDGDLEVLNPPRHLVQGREYGDLVLDGFGVCRGRGERQRDGGQRG